MLEYFLWFKVLLYDIVWVVWMTWILVGKCKHQGRAVRSRVSGIKSCCLPWYLTRFSVNRGSDNMAEKVFRFSSLCGCNCHCNCHCNNNFYCPLLAESPSFFKCLVKKHLQKWYTFFEFSAVQDSRRKTSAL